MTCIAWDGKSVAADRQMNYGNFRREFHKLQQHKREILATCGTACSGLALVEWYVQGCKKQDFPAIQSDKEEWSSLIVISVHGVWVYEKTSEPLPVYEPFMAWGSGRDFAMGAMAMGADAKQAVEIACKYDVNCGMGIDVMEIAR